MEIHKDNIIISMDLDDFLDILEGGYFDDTLIAMDEFSEMNQEDFQDLMDSFMDPNVEKQVFTSAEEFNNYMDSLFKEASVDTNSNELISNKNNKNEEDEKVEHLLYTFRSVINNGTSH